MNLNQLINKIETQLFSYYHDKTLCHQYAWWMLQKISGKTKTELIAHGIVLTPQQEQQLQLWIDAQIKDHKPLQYILGSVPFVDAEIIVQSPILIPRPETEEWVLQLINTLKTLKNKNITMLDLATGTGCIAIALAQALPNAHIYATDISDDALKLTQKNSRHNKIKNLTVLKSDVFKQLPTHIKFDIIVSNPPYITADEYKKLAASVLQWEDKNALVADDQGLATIKKIIQNSPDYLKQNTELKEKKIPQLCIEIGHKQGNTVKQLMQQQGFVDIQIKKDLAKKDRLVCGRYNEKRESS